MELFGIRFFAPTAGRGATDLLERLRKADPDAVAECYDEHHDAIRAFACRLLGDRELAEDVVHEVFVELPKSVKRFRGDSSLRTFLFGIAANRARRHLRSTSRRRNAMEGLAREPQNGGGASPDDRASDNQLAEALAHALDSLPTDQRVAFVLCEIEEMGSPEAAAVLGVPDATVRTRLFHAKRKLRRHLERGGFR
jgi:RNA polymerase sigma-70 factor (ECF subfamily)